MKFAFTFTLTLIAASVSAQNSAPAPVPQSACGPTNVKFQINIDDGHSPNPKVEPGKALVFVIEDQQYTGANDVTVRVGLDGAWVGATQGDSYLFFTVEPGEHHLCVDIRPGMLSPGRLVSLFGLTAEEGSVYYFRARTTGGPSAAVAPDHTISVDLDLVNSDEGRLLVDSSRLSVSDPKPIKTEKKK
jgi:hypothetical protein